MAKDKYVTRAANVAMYVETGAPITNMEGATDCPIPECKIFTLTDISTGAMIQLDEHMLEFLYKEARYEIDRAA